MSMTFNMVGGGGGKLKNTDAVLIVTVPTGSTCTATKGGTTLTPTMWVKAEDQKLDCAIFSIPASKFDSVTPWTVTATDGTDTASTAVLITTNKEYELSLSYSYILFDASGFNVRFTNIEGATIRANKISGTHTDSFLAARTTQKVNFATIGKAILSVNYTVTRYSSYTYPFNLVVSDGTGTYDYIDPVETQPPPNVIAYAQNNYPPTTGTVITLDLDVSSITGEHYIGFATYGYITNVTKMFLHD